MDNGRIWLPAGGGSGCRVEAPGGSGRFLSPEAQEAEVVIISASIKRVTLKMGDANGPGIREIRKLRERQGRPAARSRWGIFNFGDIGIIPHFLQRVKLTCFFIENMNDDINVIQNDPFLAFKALFAPYVLAGLFLDLLGDIVGEGADLGVGTTLAYDEKVGQRGQLAYIQNAQLFSFLFLQGFIDE